MMNEDTLKYIEDYFEGNLSDKENATFQNRLENDEAFAGQVDLFQSAKTVIQLNYRDRLIADAQELLEKQETKKETTQPAPRTISIFKNRVLQIAASILLLAATVWLIQNYLKAPSNQQLFAQHFEMPSAPNVRNSQSPTDELWENAVESYHNENFGVAISDMEKLLENPETSLKDRIYFYQGIAFLKNEQAPEAIEVFKKISKESSYIQQAEWYIVLGYLAVDNTIEAKKALEVIRNNNGHYKNGAAEKLMKTIKTQ